ncbi:hypothetical protein Tco_1351998 [Tanacetum coccineum]
MLLRTHQENLSTNITDRDDVFSLCSEMAVIFCFLAIEKLQVDVKNEMQQKYFSVCMTSCIVSISQKLLCSNAESFRIPQTHVMVPLRYRKIAFFSSKFAVEIGSLYRPIWKLTHVILLRGAMKSLIALV